MMVKRLSCTMKLKRDCELNKEGNNPEIVMIDPLVIDEGIVSVSKGSLLYTIKGRIKDQSKIEFIKINSKDAIFNKDSLNPSFELELNIQENKDLAITAFDVYQNSETWNYKVVETEVNPPVVKLMAPYASDDGTIYLDSDDPTLYIEGKMMDESLIKNINIDGATASFVLNGAISTNKAGILCFSARLRIYASSTSEMTQAISAGSVPASIASMIA